MFWRKGLDIYATSADYDPSAEASQKFFAVVQNKVHWAAHGHAAAVLFASLVDDPPCHPAQFPAEVAWPSMASEVFELR